MDSNFMGAPSVNPFIRYEQKSVNQTVSWFTYRLFSRIKHFDALYVLVLYRYWYQNTGEFTSNQIAELQKHSLARVLCDSGDDINEVQSDIFQRAIYPDGYLSCDQIPGMNLTVAWMDSGDNDCT